MTGPPLKPHAYVLAVQDLARSTAYFVDVLGFAMEWRDGDNWQALVRGEVRLMLGRCPNVQPASALGDHSYFAYLTTEDVDALHREVSARGASILFAPTDRPWGMRELGVATPDGHRMVFAQEVG